MNITGSRSKQLRTESKNTRFWLGAFFSAVLACMISLLAPIRAKTQFSDGNDSTPRRDAVQHVLLLSLDGMHSLDVANLVKDRPESALAKLSLHALTYSNASTSFPSNSWPGLLSMVSGGSPNATGVIFENSYDRSLSAPASNCARMGTPVIFDSSIDKNRDAVDGGGGIDSNKLPKDPKKGCTPVFPHNFIRVNTIFEVIKRGGGRTAWSDKHPAYDFVNGPSGTGVDDLFTPEVRSFRGLKNTELYDDLKVAAILNEINGRDHTGTREVDRTADVVNALRKIQEEAGIQEIYSGESLKLLFNDPKSDPRVPDIIIQPTPGQSYVDSGSTFIAEHGGNANTDRGVPLLIYHLRFRRQEIKFPVQTSQIAPSILRALGLNPFSLDAVRIEKTPFLPGLDFGQLQRSVPSPGKK